MAKQITISKNKPIFKEGDSGNCMYLILGEADAKVGIYANYGTNRETLLTELRVSDYFGEMALVGENIRSATAIALTDVYLEVIEEADFDEFAKEHPETLLEIVRKASVRLRKLTKDYTEAGITLAKYVEAKEKGDIPQDIIDAMERFA